MGEEIEHRVRAEIHRLHEFFVNWFCGRSQNTAAVFKSEFTDRVDSGAVLVPPGGGLVTLDHLAQGIRDRHGSNPDFRIAIRDVVIRGVYGMHVLATYEEWQRNARASTPPNNGRLTSAIFAAGDTLKWAHVHETWLPKDVMRAGPYDF